MGGSMSPSEHASPPAIVTRQCPKEDVTKHCALELPPEDVEVLRSTWALYKDLDAGSEIAIILKLIDIAPELIQFFPFSNENGTNNYAALESHVASIKSVIDRCVNGLQEPKKLTTFLEQLGERHVGYGLKGMSSALPAVAKAVIWMVGRTLSVRWTPQVKVVWIAFFKGILHHMISGLDSGMEGAGGGDEPILDKSPGREGQGDDERPAQLGSHPNVSFDKWTAQPGLQPATAGPIPALLASRLRFSVTAGGTISARAATPKAAEQDLDTILNPRVVGLQSDVASISTGMSPRLHTPKASSCAESPKAGPAMLRSWSRGSKGSSVSGLGAGEGAVASALQSVVISPGEMDLVRGSLARLSADRDGAALKLLERASTMSRGLDQTLIETSGVADLGLDPAAATLETAMGLLQAVEAVAAVVDRHKALALNLTSIGGRLTRLARCRSHLEALRMAWISVVVDITEPEATAKVTDAWHKVLDVLVGSLRASTGGGGHIFRVLGAGGGTELTIGSQKPRARTPEEHEEGAEPSNKSRLSRICTRDSAHSPRTPSARPFISPTNLRTPDKSGLREEPREDADEESDGSDWQDNTAATVRKERELLYKMLPRKVAHALQEGRAVEPEDYESVTIFFSDIVGFTNIASSLKPSEVMNLLERLYTRFDAICAKHELFKVETIGDSYMAVSGLPKRCPDHANKVAAFAVDVIKAARLVPVSTSDPSMGHVTLRVGFHSGPVIASVVGKMNPRYCLFGDTVNTASRMESTSLPGMVQMSSVSAEQMMASGAAWEISSRGMMQVKGKGEMETFFLLHADLPDPPEENLQDTASWISPLKIPNTLGEEWGGPATGPSLRHQYSRRRSMPSPDAMRRSFSIPCGLDVFPNPTAREEGEGRGGAAVGGEAGLESPIANRPGFVRQWAGIVDGDSPMWAEADPDSINEAAWGADGKIDHLGIWGGGDTPEGLRVARPSL